ncbi:Zinc finger BED domain-containing protein DAYSLEEPER [Rhynchospora pubera]|uniref:Zinc finger BED domain-containing protein DAYSLEEPER n=1 Tax=Rhynchospora pubera TaxID=906938 RepID=A0AAV8CAE7_9POAL|nr:Zinc finger BED domain-containing protein DAYSLEEPER [Rhynchospora pubera]
MTQSQASVAAETNEEELQVSSGSEAEAEAETPSPTTSAGGNSQSGKKRKCSSEIWLNFKQNEREKVYCIHCQKHYKKVKGGGSDEGDPVWVNGKWDPVKDREMLANVIVGHELTFMFSEYSLFHKYMLYNNPLWQKVSRTTITKECMKVVESERVKLKKVFKDVDKVWNSTFHMLDVAIHYKLALDGYAQRDSNFEWLPNRPEWEKAEKAICDAYVDDDGFTRDMSLAMYEKFEKYWGEVNVLMAVASILDPRLKMVSVRFVYGVLYSRDEVGSRIAEVMESLKSLYGMYAKDFMSSSESTAGVPSSSSQPNNNNFWRYLESTWVEEPLVADLDNYLKEPVFQHRSSSPFDVLQWWKTNAVRYPILSKLAKDVLCIPITTVSSESAFSAGGRILDDYRSSLKEEVVESLVLRWGLDKSKYKG